MTVQSATTSHQPEAPTTDLDTLLAERFSCRGFLPDAVPREVIDEILAATLCTPSWCNTQPWHVHVTTPETTEIWRHELADRLRSEPTEEPDIPFPPGYVGEYDARRKETAWQLYESVGIEKGDRTASLQQTLLNFTFFDAPHVAILTTTASLGTYGAVDCGLFLQSFLLAARSRGVSTIAQAALASQAPFFRERLELDDDRQVLVGISLGYADPDHPANGFRTHRVGLDTARTWI